MREVQALPQAFETLPMYPAARDELEVWKGWTEASFTQRRWPTIGVDMTEIPPEERPRYVTSWRAVLAVWAQDLTVAVDDTPLTAYRALQRAHELPPPVLRAAEHLTMFCLESGITSTDVLFLCALFAWPLRDVFVELGDLCWQYLIHAPWQTDSASLKDMLTAVDEHGAFEGGRSLLELVDAKEAAGHYASARELLEAVVLVQAKRTHLDRLVSYRDFVIKPAIKDANLAIVRLAELYHNTGEDQVWAREIMKRAAEITRSRRLIQAIETRVWDRPLDEIYAWTDSVRHPRQFDAAIQRAIDAQQPHHARRIAEAMLVRKFDRPWYGSALERVPSSVEKFCSALAVEVPQDMVARRAAEHLAVLYVRTSHITSHARQFIRCVSQSIDFTGRGAELYALREEMEFFYNRSDPYRILRDETSLLDAERAALSEDEQRASDEVQEWFADRFNQENPRALARVADVISAPLIDAARTHEDIALVEEVFLGAFRIMVEQGRRLAGDLDALNRRAAVIRSKHGYGSRLMSYASEVTSFEPRAAGILSAGTSMMFPGLSLLSHPADLGSSLLLAFRGIARVGAVFGRDVREEESFRFVMDVFALGLSSRDGEGLLAYMSRDQEEIASSVTVGAVAYGTSRLVEYLWTVPGLGNRATEQLLRHTARLCGIELSQRAMVRLVPIVGALISGVSTYKFVRTIIDAAIHVAARDALLSRAQAYA